MKKSKSEIESEIAKLSECKKYAPRSTAFGDDNHANIDLQIECLRGDIDVTAEEFSEDFTEDAQSVILEAYDWANGQIKESPSSGWDSYKPKK